MRLGKREGDGGVGGTEWRNPTIVSVSLFLVDLSRGSRRGSYTKQCIGRPLHSLDIAHAVRRIHVQIHRPDVPLHRSIHPKKRHFNHLAAPSRYELALRMGEASLSAIFACLLGFDRAVRHSCRPELRGTSSALHVRKWGFDRSAPPFLGSGQHTPQSFRSVAFLLPPSEWESPFGCLGSKGDFHSDRSGGRFLSNLGFL